MDDNLKDILTKPTMDEAMDQKIYSTLLNYESNPQKHKSIHKIQSTKLLVANLMKYRTAQIAMVFLCFIILGVGTVWATGLYKVKSNPTNIRYMTDVDLEAEGYTESVRINYADKKTFGIGNKKIELWADEYENPYKINDNGDYVHPDGSIYPAPYVPNPDRHEADRLSGDEAFAYIGFPNLMPTLLYKDYLLGDYMAYQYNKTVLGDGEDTHHSIMAEFFPDYEIGSFFNETIWVTFNTYDTPVKRTTIVLQEDRGDVYSLFTYITSNGIICSMEENADANRVIANITFESEDFGVAYFMIEFQKVEMDRIKEILDTIPLMDDMNTTTSDISVE